MAVIPSTPRADLIVLRCADLEASRAFYEALGLEVIAEQHGNGPRHFSVQPGQLVLELYPLADRVTSGLRLGLVLDDIAAAVARLRLLSGGAVTMDASPAELRALLLSTADARIVEHTENDDCWGDGGDGRGKNLLGRILMEVREQLRAGPTQPPRATGRAARRNG